MPRSGAIRHSLFYKPELTSVGFMISVAAGAASSQEHLWDSGIIWVDQGASLYIDAPVGGGGRSHFNLCFQQARTKGSFLTSTGYARAIGIVDTSCPRFRGNQEGSDLG